MHAPHLAEPVQIKIHILHDDSSSWVVDTGASFSVLGLRGLAEEHLHSLKDKKTLFSPVRIRFGDNPKDYMAFSEATVEIGNLIIKHTLLVEETSVRIISVSSFLEQNLSTRAEFTKEGGSFIKDGIQLATFAFHKGLYYLLEPEYQPRIHSTQTTQDHVLAHKRLGHAGMNRMSTHL